RRPPFRHGRRALDSRCRARTDPRSAVARGPSRPYCGRGRARLVHRARAHRHHRRLERRSRRRAAVSSGHLRRRAFMLANPIARTSRAVMLALGLAFTACVGAADAQQPTAGAIATAKELITVKGAGALYDPIVPGVIEHAKSVFLQANPTLGKDLNEVALKLRTEYAPRSAELMNEVAKLYATR